MKYTVDWSDIGAALVALLALAIVVYALAFMVVAAKTEAVCAQHGWRDYTVTWNFTQYCVREENEYEIIKPLHEIVEEAIQ